MENPIKMDDLGVPLFLETPKWTSKRAFKVVQVDHLLLLFEYVSNGFFR